MPLPEGLSELLFAGMLAGRRFAWRRREDGFVGLGGRRLHDHRVGGPRPHPARGPLRGPPRLLQPDPPLSRFLRVTSVTHRTGAIWPLTVVGRPPQEDTTFGQLIHEITEPMVPTTLPGVHSVHAVDAAGVHPLLLAVGSERYSPVHRPSAPGTVDHRERDPGLRTVLACQVPVHRGPRRRAGAGRPRHSGGCWTMSWRRVDLASDLHFQTRTTIDTLDYSGTGLNAGSKLVIAGSRSGTAVNSPAKSLRGVGGALPDGVFGPLAWCCRASSSWADRDSIPTNGWRPTWPHCGTRT